ncbi:TRAF3-interacting JNK-activating modulator [Pseudoliparis swirei]|uniref:TRAF3-interacting JNK-activating modulator n=1 Tax=Pseudoliparis swirei TaxID=2059687 RepID=UPI0024BDA329|nr:TRAF3-interacting JNK-activating modulator [Pseudoliparis swirei]
MDTMTVSGIQLSPVKHFQQIVDIRAEKREHMRGRNNVTACRSPTRDFDTRMIKNELKEKRQLEFLRRRSVSPEPCGLTTNYYSRGKPSTNTFSMKQYSSIKSETFHTDVHNTPTANGRHTKMISTPNKSVTEGPSTSNWASLWTEQVTLMRAEKGHAGKQASTSTPAIKESNQQRAKSTDKRENSLNAKKTSNRTFIQKNIQHETSVQTESGLVTVRESDVQRLTDYLQEALWREEAVKKKLVTLQESTSRLMNSSNTIWTARCSEDLLRNQIKALEAQLQVCLQKFPKDGVKKLLIQMEKQKLVYEERALIALQKVTQEKTEALIKSETMQEALNTAKAEAQRWQGLCKELKLSSEQLRENQHLYNDQMQQLHSQVELSRTREAEMREEVVSLRQEKKALQYNMCLLEEDNQILREEIQHLRDGSKESQGSMMQGLLTSEEAEPRLMERRDSQVEEQLHHTQDKLRLKERECEELQKELNAMEQECQSSQARLSQCRDELRQPSHRSRRPTRFGSWWKVSLTFLLLLGVVGVAMLWLWYPPFREQAVLLYSDIEARIKDYLMGMASPQHCFRPI